MDDLNRSKIPAPFETERVVVKPEWVDYNGHMNVAYYPVAFDNAFDEVYDFLGVGNEGIKRTGISTFVAETHFTYQQELRTGQRLRITTQLLDFDAKRLQVFQAMYHAGEGFLAATGEWLILCRKANRNSWRLHIAARNLHGGAAPKAQVKHPDPK